MSNRARMFTAAIGVIFAISLAGPPPSQPVTAVGGGVEQAGAQKSGKASGGQAEQVGENAADLLSGWLSPLLFAAIGCFALVALLKREIGLAVSGAVIGLIAGLFLLAPDAAERTFTAIYERVF